MSGRIWQATRGSQQRLYRDRENGWIFGVCAGIADRFGWPPIGVRIVAAALLLLLFWPTVIAYLLAVVLLREKPLTWRGRHAEHEFWRGSASEYRRYGR